MLRRVFHLGALAVAISSLLSSAYAIDVGQSAPQFELEKLTGGTQLLSQERGKVVYLDFWATWCGPCRHTLPWMAELAERYRGRNVTVLAVNLDKDKAKVQEAVKDFPNLNVLLNPAGDVAKQFSLPTMPTSFLIDANGVVKLVHPAFHDGDEKVIESAIDQLLNR